MNSTIAILIVFYNKISQTISCIDSFVLSKQNIYILNNASDRKSWQVLKNRYSSYTSIIFFDSDINLGPAGGRNLLIEKSKEEWIFIVDNDVCIRQENSWKKNFDEQISKNKKYKIFSPRIFNVHENSLVSANRFIKRGNTIYLEYTNAPVTNSFSCCGVIIHRDIFNLYGKFDDKLFAFEDYEFAIRAICSKFGEIEVYQLSEIELLHDHQVQTSQIDKKAILVRYDQNRIHASMEWLTKKHKIQFEHNWEWWTKKQLSEMYGKSIMQRVKNIFKR